jgi:hypothetical protein
MLKPAGTFAFAPNVLIQRPALHWTGGVYGLESSIWAIGMAAIMSAILIVIAVRRSEIADAHYLLHGSGFEAFGAGGNIRQIWRAPA